MGTSAFLKEKEQELLQPSRMHRLEALVNGQAAVLEMIADGTPLDGILDAILKWVEDQSQSGLKASILLLDKEGVSLRHGAAPSLPDAYNKAIHNVRIGPDVGSCGTAAFTREQVIVEDIADSDLWVNYRELALRHGLRACWSTPLVKKDGKVLGTFAIYYNEPRTPTDDDLQLIHLVSRTAEIAIEYKQNEEERERLRHLDRTLNDKVRK